MMISLELLFSDNDGAILDTISNEHHRIKVQKTNILYTNKYSLKIDLSFNMALERKAFVEMLKFSHRYSD